MRKHLSLIIEHDDEDRVGGVSFYDSRKARVTKNEASPIHHYDEGEGDFYVAGKEVGCGYIDFEDEAEYNDNQRVSELTKQKLSEIDREWVERAGIEEVLDDD